LTKNKRKNSDWNPGLTFERIGSEQFCCSGLCVTDNLDTVCGSFTVCEFTKGWKMITDSATLYLKKHLKRGNGGGLR
jgi:hypothetical protein